MSEELDKQLSEAVENSDLAMVKCAVKYGANINATNEWPMLSFTVESTSPNAIAIVKHLCEHGADVNTNDGWVLVYAAGSTNPDALAIVKYLVEQGADIDASHGAALRHAAGNAHPDALAIVKYLVEHGRKRPNGSWERANVDTNDGAALKWAAENHNPDASAIIEYLINHSRKCQSTLSNETHSRYEFLGTLVAISLERGNYAVADYLLSRDDFLPSDLIPCSLKLSPDTYRAYREKAMVHICGLVDANGLEYARVVAADIEKILKSDDPKATKEDVEAFTPVVSKISSLDWMNDAQVMSGDFLPYEMTR